MLTDYVVVLTHSVLEIRTAYITWFQLVNVHSMTLGVIWLKMFHESLKQKEIKGLNGFQQMKD